MAALTPASVFRRFVTDGVPSSGKHKPSKDEIIQLLNQFFGVSRGGWVVARTKTELDGVTPDDETDGGVVLTGAGAGYYDRDAGEWVFGRGFPDTFARVTLGGTANAQTGTVSAGVNPADIEVFIAFVTTPNTGPMTLSVDGETARDVVNVAGNALSAGEWTGIVLYVLNDDGDYQLIIDAGAAASAAQSASEAAASDLSAEGHADRAEAAAQSVVARAWFKTVADLIADSNSVIGYTGSGADFIVAAGDIIEAQGFRYEVVASGATEFDEETAGGVRLVLITKPVNSVPEAYTEAEKAQARRNIRARRDLTGDDYIFPAIGPGRQIVAAGVDDEQFREIGNILYDPDDAAYPYKTVYSAHAGAYTENNVFLFGAKSADGETWVKTGQISTRSGEDPYLVKDGATYHIFCEDKEVVPFRNIRRYTATVFDGTWTDQGDALTYNSAAWENGDVSSPVVWKEGSTWYMFYEGRGTSQLGAVGLATAAVLSGPWTKSGSNPIITGYQTARGPLGWASHLVPDDIVKIDEAYYLLVHGFIRDHNTVAFGDWKIMPGMLSSRSLTSGWVDVVGEPISVPTITDSSDPQIIDTLMYRHIGDQIDVIASDFTNGLRAHPLLYSGAANVFRGVRTSSPFSLGSGVFTTVPTPTVVADTLNGWDNANNRWLCKRSGFYNVTAMISLAGTATDALYSMKILINGSYEIPLGQSSAASSTSMLYTATDVIFLMSGDTVQLQGFVAGGNSGNVTAKLNIVKV